MIPKKLANGKWQVRWRDETKMQRAKNFRSRERAEDWVRKFYRDEKAKTEAMSPPDNPTLAEVIEEWRRRVVIKDSTRVTYENKIRLHFAPLLPIRIRSITPRVLDHWIDHMKSEPNRYGKGNIRQSFRQELKTLTAILHYYAEYSDDDAYVIPVKRRHRQAIKLRNRPRAVPKDLSEAHFKLFADELCYGPEGEQMKALATIQFYHALRVSEVTALHWDDVHFDPEPHKSRLSVSRHILYLRSKTHLDREDSGFKNSEGQEGVKEHPMMPESYAALRSLWREGATGLIFRDPRTGVFWSYRVIQARFNRTFARLGLPYRSTHIMRHGGTRMTLDDSGGDIGVAQQLLGNLDRKTVDIYAKRSARALTQYAAGEWLQATSAQNVHSAGGSLKLVKEDK